MLERVAHAGAHTLTLLLIVFAASLADVRRAPPPAPVVAAPVAPSAPVHVDAPPPPSASWPRLTRDGLSGMTVADMASIGAVLHAFPGAVLTPRWSRQTLELDPPVHELIAVLWNLLDVRWGEASHYAAIEVAGGRATSVTVTRPGVMTEDGIQVGDPLAAVLAVRALHRCEAKTRVRDVMISGGMVERFVRCRVGALRYDADATMLELASFDENFTAVEVRPPPPSGGRALDRWIAGAGLRINEIAWEP